MLKRLKGELDSQSVHFTFFIIPLQSRAWVLNYEHKVDQVTILGYHEFSFLPSNLMNEIQP